MASQGQKDLRDLEGRMESPDTQGNEEKLVSKGRMVFLVHLE